MIWRPYGEGEHEDVPGIAQDWTVFDRDIWLHCWNHCHFQQISWALRQLGRRQAQPRAHPFQVWREIRGGGGRARHWVDTYGPQLLDWVRVGSTTPVDASVEDELAWARWMDDQFSGLMVFHNSHFLGRSNLPMGDTAPDVAAMAMGELRESVLSHWIQMEIVMSI